MPLRTFVKVSSISNLSDARYCAGMGVDMLGFCAVEGAENYVKPSHFQEIRGWVTGPHIVAELYGLKEQAELEGILENYKPDYLELGVDELPLIASLSIPLILSLESKEDLEDLPIIPAFLISDEPIDTSVPVLVKVKSRAEVEQVLKYKDVKGIAVKGGTELKPGLKNYEVINEVLELLETED